MVGVAYNMRIHSLTQFVLVYLYQYILANAWRTMVAQYSSDRVSFSFLLQQHGVCIVTYLSLLPNIHQWCPETGLDVFWRYTGIVTL